MTRALGAARYDAIAVSTTARALWVGSATVSAACILPRDRPGRPASLSIAARSVAVSKEIRSCQ
jgi:hypothetical protein